MRLLSKLMLLYHSYLFLIKLDIIRGFNFPNLGGDAETQAPPDDPGGGVENRGPNEDLFNELESVPYAVYSHSNPILQRLYTKFYFYNKHVLKLNRNFWRHLPPPRVLNRPSDVDSLLGELLSAKFDRRSARSKVSRSSGELDELRDGQIRREIGHSSPHDGRPRYLSVNSSGESIRTDSMEYESSYGTHKNRKILHYNKYLNVYNWTDHALDDTLEDYEDEENATAGPNTTTAVRPTASGPTPTKEVKKDPLFPPDPFTMEQKRNGAVVVHILGVLYMFVALAVVCDEFFVPSLDVIIEELDVQQDVAGATFMAAGGSAPELFTSVIGVFVSFDDVGIGTIVGSAVFNILFVIGVCGLLSRSVLTLTWWPLFRDTSFYSLSLMILIAFFSDNQIELHEAAILFSVYIAYVTFMKFNRQMESWVKGTLLGGRDNTPTAAQTLNEGSSITQSSSINPTHNQSAKNYRSCLVQLMVSTLDPLHDGVVDEKAAQLTALASLQVILSAEDTNNNTSGGSPSSKCGPQINGVAYNMAPPLEGVLESPPEPLDMSWPGCRTKQIIYVLLAPLMFPLWLTLPDTRTPRGKKLFVITFIGSIFWIALYSYLMVWWADISGKVAQIPPEVMGFTFLAAGTSIPDLITSVIVARKGFGDMAVSSSVGSNIFDVTVGLPLPWLLYNLIYSQPVTVSSKGMLCSIVILFMMLLFVIISIASFSWKLHRGLGLTMFLLYFIFVVLSLSFEYGYLVCPC